MRLDDAYIIAALTGDLAGQHAISVNGNWRPTFRFGDDDAALVDYQDLKIPSFFLLSTRPYWLYNPTRPTIA